MASDSKPTRFTAKRRRGIIELNGATAHLGKIGDRITIMSFARYTPEEAAVHAPRIAVLDEKNEILRYEEGDSRRSLKNRWRVGYQLGAD